MFKRRYIFVFAVLGVFLLGFHSPLQAQSYLGDLSAPKKKQAKDEAQRPIPKTFSSKVTSAQQAEVLDKLYNDLLITLWLHAETDFVSQRKLIDLIQPTRFKTTRYKAEFANDLKTSIDNLNTNYKTFMEELKTTQEQYQVIKENIGDDDHDVLDALWQERMDYITELSKTYFKMQAKFLKTYKTLVAFILKNGGGYYYSSDSAQLQFYKLGDYHYFGKSVDVLNKTSFQQEKLLRANPPGGIEIELK